MENMVKIMGKVLVTGHLGYIGPHLVEILKQKGHYVVGCDLGFFENSFVDTFVRPDKEWKQDFRSLTTEQLQDIDTVMHLAAISNDPMGDIDPSLTYSINLEGTIDFAQKCKDAGVSRFLLSSSCSIYGKGESLDLDESASLNPLTAYAKSKIESEKAISQMGDENFTVAFLRNSTAYGYSPSFRIDLVVNNLLACAFSKGEIQIKSDGEPWRPLIHCKDIARAFAAFEDAPREAIHKKAVNIGGNNENYQVKDVASRVKKSLTDASIVFTGEVGNDPRNYRVNFDLLSNVIPDFKLEYTLSSGMVELHEKLEKMNFSAEDFDGKKFVRLRLLKDFLADNKI